MNRLERLQEEYKSLQQKVNEKYKEINELASKEIKGYKVINKKTGKSFWADGLAISVTKSGISTNVNLLIKLEKSEIEAALESVDFELIKKLNSSSDIKKIDLPIYDYEILDHDDIGQSFLAFTAIKGLVNYYNTSTRVLAVRMEWYCFEMGTVLGETLRNQYQAQERALREQPRFIYNHGLV
ncbi:MAG: hypothetical protein IJ880_11870 [Bacilli bacterium]|nr:hypothetical protein [Bacilli bacterium]